MQPICTLISNLQGQPDIFLGSGTLKKIGMQHQPYFFRFCTIFFRKQREEAWLPLLFLNNKKKSPAPIFSTLFLYPIFWTLFFSGSQTDRPMFSNLEWWMQIEWAHVYIRVRSDNISSLLHPCNLSLAQFVNLVAICKDL